MVMINKTAPDSQSVDVTFDELFKYKDINKYLCNGTLTIQVDATLHFHGLTETQKQPLLHLQEW